MYSVLTMCSHVYIPLPLPVCCSPCVCVLINTVPMDGILWDIFPPVEPRADETVKKVVKGYMVARHVIH